MTRGFTARSSAARCTLAQPSTTSRGGFWNPPPVGPIEPSRACVAAGHQSGVLENSKVLGDGRPADVEVGRDLPRGQLAAPHQAQDLATAGARYGP